ncbi:hypothetical protein OIU77_025830, partial [Salix suchowensis]
MIVPSGFRFLMLLFLPLPVFLFPILSLTRTALLSLPLI